MAAIEIARTVIFQHNGRFSARFVGQKGIQHGSPGWKGVGKSAFYLMCSTYLASERQEVASLVVGFVVVGGGRCVFSVSIDFFRIPLAMVGNVLPQLVPKIVNLFVQSL